MHIRLATLEDAAAISAIYNHYVHHSTATYQDEPELVEQRAAWLQAHGHEHPVIVGEEQGMIIGWASLTRFHPRTAYRYTAENSVYVHHQWQRRGVGRALLSDLIARASLSPLRTIIAGISADQEPSLRLHASLGFRQVARLEQVGYKFGRWLDVIYMQLMLRGP